MSRSTPSHLAVPPVPPGVKPLRGLEPVVEHFRIFVEPEVLQHEGERTDRLVIARELVVIKIPPLGRMFSAHIDHQHSGVVEIALLRLATLDRSTVLRHQ